MDTYEEQMRLIAKLETAYIADLTRERRVFSEGCLYHHERPLKICRRLREEGPQKIHFDESTIFIQKAGFRAGWDAALRAVVAKIVDCT